MLGCKVHWSKDTLPNTMRHVSILTYPIQKFSAWKKFNLYPGYFENQTLATKRLPSQWTFLNRQGINKGWNNRTNDEMAVWGSKCEVASVKQQPFRIARMHSPLERSVIPVFLLRQDSSEFWSTFSGLKFIKNWREIIVHSYHNKTSWEPVSAHQILCSVYYLSIEHGNFQYSNLFYNK